MVKEGEPTDLYWFVKDSNHPLVDIENRDVHRDEIESPGSSRIVRLELVNLVEAASGSGSGPARKRFTAHQIPLTAGETIPDFCLNVQHSPHVNFTFMTETILDTKTTGVVQHDNTILLQTQVPFEKTGIYTITVNRGLNDIDLTLPANTTAPKVLADWAVIKCWQT
jgi:hypothetical protein